MNDRRKLERPRLAAMIVAGVLLAGASPAVASWSIKGHRPVLYAETRSKAGGTRLVVACEEGPKLYLYVPQEWDGGKLEATWIAIDGVRTAVNADGVDAAVVLSDLPHDAVGLSNSMRSRMKAGRELVVSGTATTRIRPAQLTFPLVGAAPAIETVERSCGAARRRR